MAAKKKTKKTAKTARRAVVKRGKNAAKRKASSPRRAPGKLAAKKAKSPAKRPGAKKGKAPAKRPAAAKAKASARRPAAKKAKASAHRPAPAKAKATPARPKPAKAAKRSHFSFDTIEQLENFSASPEVIYRLWLDSQGHAAFTGNKANVDARVGGAFTAHDAYISGITTELVENERIVQRWRAADFPAGYPDSKLELTLTPQSGGTQLKLRHTSVPEANAKSYDSGWHEHYWRPLRAYLASRQ